MIISISSELEVFLSEALREESHVEKLKKSDVLKPEIKTWKTLKMAKRTRKAFLLVGLEKCNRVCGSQDYIV